MLYGVQQIAVSRARHLTNFMKNNNKKYQSRTLKTYVCYRSANEPKIFFSRKKPPPLLSPSERNRKSEKLEYINPKTCSPLSLHRDRKRVISKKSGA